MDPIKFELPDIANESLKPLAQSIGNTLSSIWSMCFGWIDISAEKIQFKRQLSLKAFKENLEAEISKIPEDKLCEPKLSVVGPALEASKFFFEESELREMFSKLIANAMNRDTQDYVQNSFVEIIKQMSPNDARILRIFKDESSQLPIACFRLNSKDGNGFTDIYPLVFLHRSIADEMLGESMISINNLRRLGLITTTFTEYLVNDEMYELYMNSHFRSDPINLHSNPRIALNDGERLEVVKGIAKLTEYGAVFNLTCM